MKKLIMALALFAAQHAAAVQTKVFVADGVLHYIGGLDEEANSRLFALYDAQPDKPHKLMIESGGGSVDVGMALGRWVHEHDLTVVVPKFCFSSCANYVFTAGRKKIVGNAAVIGFHGGAASTVFGMSESDRARIALLPVDERDAARFTWEQEVMAFTRPIAERERRYFDAIGVQQRITTLGQEPDYRHNRTVGTPGWTYTLADFHKFGVHDIDVIDPPWNPKLNKVPVDFIPAP